MWEEEREAKDRAANKTHKPKTYDSHDKQNPSNPWPTPQPQQPTSVTTHPPRSQPQPKPTTPILTPTKIHHPDLNPGYVNDPRTQTHKPKPTKLSEHIRPRTTTIDKAQSSIEHTHRWTISTKHRERREKKVMEREKRKIEERKPEVNKK